MNKTLKIKAKDNHGHEYGVELQMWTAPNRPMSDSSRDKWILRILNTPGSWYMSTLLESHNHWQYGIAIDLGQGWYCTNFREVMDEAKQEI